jgi:hypothetical protein
MCLKAGTHRALNTSSVEPDTRQQSPLLAVINEPIWQAKL